MSCKKIIDALMGLANLLGEGIVPKMLPDPAADAGWDGQILQITEQNPDYSVELNFPEGHI